MKKSFLAACVVASFFSASNVARLAAQNPAGRPPGPPAGALPSVAVVDIETVFKSLASFKQQMEIMQKDVKAAEDKLNQERQMINKMIEKLKDSGLKPNSPEFRRMETDIAQKQADYQVRKQLQTRDLMEREASIYYKTYQEINETIRYYAESRGITLVLRYSSNPVDPTDRESVFRELSKPVVYQHSSDVTQIVIEEMNRRNVAGNRGAPGGPPRAGMPPGSQGGSAPNGPGGPSRPQPLQY